MPVSYATVTGTFPAGTAAYPQFTPSEAVNIDGAPELLGAQPVKASIVDGALLGPDGTSPLQLPRTDQGTPVGGTGFWFWTVTGLPGVPSFSFFLTADADITELINSPAAGGGGGAALPLSTLGDLLYEDATPAPARLAGNTAAARKFLRQQGNGTVSAAPAWDVLQAGDVPGVAGIAVSGTPSAGEVLTATGAAAADWAPAPAGDQPWQFRPEDHGAAGDGKVISDLVLNGTQTATSATAAFTSADTGKTIMINGGAGAASPPLVTTITFVNATTVTLGLAASVSGTDFQAVYGTDDTAAISAAVAAAGAYALANGYFAEVLFSPAIYMLATAAAQTGNGTSAPTFNAQVPLPYPAANGTSRKLVIALTGAGDAGFVQYWESTAPNLAGTVLVSTTTAPSTPDAVFGNQSVIGGPSGSAGFTGGYANVKPVIKGIMVVCGAYTNQYAYDFAFCSAMHVDAASAHIFAPAGAGGGNSPLLKDMPAQAGFQNKIGCGLRAPVTGNNADVTCYNFTAEGYSRSFYLYDHFTAGRLFSIYADVAVKIDTSLGVSGIEHRITIANLSCEVFNGGISTTGSGGPYVPVDICMDAETPPDPAYDISDSGGILYGVIRWTDPADARAHPAVTGAANVKIINDKLGPGAWSGAPAAPGTGVSQQNTAWRDATVTVTSTAAITAAAVDGSAVFSGSVPAGTPVQVRVPAGHAYTVTSAGGTLTTHWVLD